MFVEKFNSYLYFWGGKGFRDVYYGFLDEFEEDRCY